MRYFVYIFVIAALIGTVFVTYGETREKELEKIKKEIKEKEKFKPGDVVKNNYGNLLEIVPYKEFRAWKIEKGYWSGFTVDYEKTTLYYCKNQKGTYYSTECKKDVTKATKIEEFIFKNGGKENE